MKAFALGLSVALLAASGAQAAHLPVKAPIYKAAPAAVYDWTGFYVGVNAGGSVGRSRTHTEDPGAINENETTFLSAVGAVGGVQAGYNWQIPRTPLVIGVEADIQGSGQRGSACLANCNLDGTIALNLEQRVDWFGTARGRIGLASGPVLSYVTAGFAYGHVSTTGSFVGFAPPPVPFALGGNRSGYVVGGGTEASLGGNWTAKIEYLYLNLGQSNLVVPTAGPVAIIFGTPVNVSTDVRDHIFRAGLNYRFGGNAAAAPLGNWAGFYIGGNGGSIVARNPSTYRIGPENGAPPNLETFNLVPEGFLGGVQAGYNWQAGAWVFGVEADIQGTTARDRDSCVLGCTPFVGTIAIDQKISWLGTVRGRLGYSVGSTLFYGTAGYAFGETRTVIAAAAFPPPLFYSSFNHARSGYAVGGGIESPLDIFGILGPNWTASAEYLFVDLGRSTDVLTPFGSTDTFTTRTQAHIFRTGVNYHFNKPVVAKY